MSRYQKPGEFSQISLVILIQDGAPYHTSKAMRQFFAKKANRITVFELPSFSPDYNPIEKLWKKIKEREIHLHYFPTFDSLKNKVEEALLHFKDLKNEVLSLFGFYNKLAKAWSKFNPNSFSWKLYVSETEEPLNLLNSHNIFVPS